MPALVPMLVTADGIDGVSRDLFTLSATPQHAVDKMLKYFVESIEEMENVGVWNVGAMIAGGCTETGVLEWDQKYHTVIK